MVDQELDLGLPASGILDLVQEQYSRPALALDVRVIERKNIPQTQQLEHWVVETEIEDRAGFETLAQERLGELVEHRGLAYPARPGQQDRPPQRRVVEVDAAGVEGQATKDRGGHRTPQPPGVETLQDRNPLVKGDKLSHWHVLSIIPRYMLVVLAIK